MKLLRKIYHILGQDGVNREGIIRIYLADQKNDEYESKIVVQILNDNVYTETFRNIDGLERHIQHAENVLKTYLGETKGAKKEHIDLLKNKYKFI